MKITRSQIRKLIRESLNEARAPRSDRFQNARRISRDDVRNIPNVQDRVPGIITPDEIDIETKLPPCVNNIDFTPWCDDPAWGSYSGANNAIYQGDSTVRPGDFEVTIRNGSNINLSQWLDSEGNFKEDLAHNDMINGLGASGSPVAIRYNETKQVINVTWVNPYQSAVEELFQDWDAKASTGWYNKLQSGSSTYLSLGAGWFDKYPLLARLGVDFAIDQDDDGNDILALDNSLNGDSGKLNDILNNPKGCKSWACLEQTAKVIRSFYDDGEIDWYYPAPGCY